jgi:hypothetical protein
LTSKDGAVLMKIFSNSDGTVRLGECHVKLKKDYVRNVINLVDTEFLAITYDDDRLVKFNRNDTSDTYETVYEGIANGA